MKMFEVDGSSPSTGKVTNVGSSGIEITSDNNVKTIVPPQRLSSLSKDINNSSQFDLSQSKLHSNNQNDVNQSNTSVDTADPNMPKLGSTVNITTNEDSSSEFSDQEILKVIDNHDYDRMLELMNGEFEPGSSADIVSQTLRALTDEYINKIEDEAGVYDEQDALRYAAGKLLKDPAFNALLGDEELAEINDYDDDGAGNVGGDPTDEFINDVVDNKWERAARRGFDNERSPNSLAEDDELAKMLTTAGLR